MCHFRVASRGQPEWHGPAGGRPRMSHETHRRPNMNAPVARDWRRLLASIVALALIALAFTVASAQSSGGAMGGGDWGGGGAPSRSSGDYSSSSRPSGGPGGDYSSSSRSTGGRRTYDSDSRSYDGGAGRGRGGPGEAGDGSGGEWLLILIVGGFFALLVHFLITEHEEQMALRRTPSRDIDVTMIRIVLDNRARAGVQAVLDRLGTTAATGSAEGRVRMLNEVAILLRRNRAAWVYGAVSNHLMTTQDSARATFQTHVAAARSTYRDETIRNFDGEVSRAESSAVPASAEGPGLVMVSVMVAARRELVTVDRIGNGEGLRRALEALSNLTPTSLVAVEVVWTPSDPDDRMTSAEVERLLAGSTYAKIDGALVGVAVCDFCQGLYPAEAFACVHCGAAPRSLAGQGVQ